jgi:succinyl-CoA synthetase alpha subunit
MSVLESLVGSKNVKVLFQGMGGFGKHYAITCREFGTQIGAGISLSPDKDGTFFEGIPIYNNVKEAVEKEAVNASIIFVPAINGRGADINYGTFSKTISKAMPTMPKKPVLTAVGDAIIEAIWNEIPFIVCITDGIPQQDMRYVKAYLREVNSYLRLQYREISLIGSNTPGVVFPHERVKMGIIPSDVVTTGNIGIVSKSGSLTYEAIKLLSANRFGQSAIIGIGGDANRGLGFVDCFKLFEKDIHTKVVVLMGEIGGDEEKRAAEAIEKGIITKQVIAYVVGKTAPKGKTMGHAGAINKEKGESAQEKIEMLRSAGVLVADSIEEIVKIVKRTV